MKSSAQVSLFNRVSFLDKLLFTKHLSMMIKSGITIGEALDILTSQTKSQSFKTVLAQVGDDIRNGKSLSGALAKHPHIFDAFYTNMVEIGETSGTLDESLLYLSEQLNKTNIIRKKMQSALLYPTIVVVAACVVGIGVSLFVMPKLLELFQGFDVQLPLSTQSLLFIAAAMRDYGVLIFAVLIGLVLLGRVAITRPEVKPAWDQFVLSIPIFGTLVQNTELTILFRNLGVMLRSGLPVTSAIVVQEKMTTNTVFKQYLTSLTTALDNGQSLATELANSKYHSIPIIATKMIAVGEKTGKLEESFGYLGDFFEDEVDDTTRNLSTLLEPIMLLVIGAIVAFVALSIISPIYELTGSIKR